MCMCVCVSVCVCDVLVVSVNQCPPKIKGYPLEFLDLEEGENILLNCKTGMSPPL